MSWAFLLKSAIRYAKHVATLPDRAARHAYGFDQEGLHEGIAEPRSRGATRPGFDKILSLFKRQRAQGKPGARCTRGLACKMVARKRTRAYRFSGNTPAFPAQWFYGLFRALPGERAFLPPSPPRSLLRKNLTPASGRQDHTTSPSASGALVRNTVRVHRIPLRVRDDARRPSVWAGWRGVLEVICLISENQNIFAKGAGQDFVDLPVGSGQPSDQLSKQ